MNRREMLAGGMALSIGAGLAAPAHSAAPTAPRTAPGPTAAQAAWTNLRYGMFLHFGPNTLKTQAGGWGDGTFPARDVVFPRFDPDQWASVARDAGMLYAVLTAKHHDGFCNWNSDATAYCMRSSPMKVDIVEKTASAFRKAGLRFGIYYSLWDRNCPFYEDDARYADYMVRQVTELLTRYGDMVEIWFDGGWDKDNPSRDWENRPEWQSDPAWRANLGKRWRWRELYAHIHALQPDCLVIQNSSSDLPGQIKYGPVDVRTAEHFDFVWREEIKVPRRDPVFEIEGKSVYLPIEYCTTLNQDWFDNGSAGQPHPSAATIADWYQRAVADGGNLLLNVGPNRLGLISEVHRSYLVEARRRLKI